jgi:hypothetical protein
MGTQQFCGRHGYVPISVSQFPKWQANKCEKKEKRVEENGLNNATMSKKKYKTKRQTKEKKSRFRKG